MATWVMSGYAVSAVEVLSGGSLDSVGSTFRITPTWDASADALTFSVIDDDFDLQGDTFSNESGDDITQSAVVTNAGGSTL